MLNALSPRLYLAIYLVFLIVRPQEFLPALANTPLLVISLSVCTVVWLFYSKKRVRAPQFLLVIGLMLTMMVSTAVNGWTGGAVKVFNDFVSSICLLIIVGSSLVTRAHIKQAFVIVILLVSVLVIHGIDQKANGIGWTGAFLSQETRITYIGVLNDPNDLALVFVMSLAFVTHFSGTGNAKFVRLLSLLAIPFFCYGVFLTESRGGLLAVGAIFIVLAGFRYGWVKAVLTGLLGGIAGGALLSGRITEIDAEEESAADRVQAWFEGFEMFQSHFFFGVGKGNFPDYNFGLTAHNSFVLALAELGLVGYFFYFSIVFLSAWMLARTLKAAKAIEQIVPLSAEGKQDRAIAITLVSALTGVLVGSFFLSRTYFGMTYFLFGLIIALYQTSFADKRKPLTVEFPKLIGKLIGCTIVSVVVLRILIKVLLVFQK